MKRLLSILCAACLCWLAAAYTSNVLAQNERKVCICHIPPGNPGNAHTICIGAPAVPAHLAHGDTLRDCSEGCDGATGNTCGVVEFCMHPSGQCDPSAGEGVCTSIPETCPPTVDPVCACNGNTYDNACLAAQAGQTVAAGGPCDALRACGGAAGVTCPVGMVCKPPEGVCLTTSTTGTCVAVPSTCTAFQNPVCGCDGVSYSNSCFTDAVGVGVLHSGECAAGPTCGGSSNAACPAGLFCKKPQGTCDLRAEGSCVAMPTTCPALVAPACGCDGKTYSNSCVADGAGITVASSGACVAPRSRSRTTKPLQPRD